MAGLKQAATLLAINGGSSSLKLAFFAVEQDHEQLILRASAQHESYGRTRATLQNAIGCVLHEEVSPTTAVTACFRTLCEMSRDRVPEPPRMIAHRVVHGGPGLREHSEIDAVTLRLLRAAVHFAPNHLPDCLELIGSATQMFPGVAQIACLDTTFHRSMPLAAKRLPIPATLYDEGIERYGFHGLAYSSVVNRLEAQLPSRLIIAHLGSGASLCAVRDGNSIDTTMSFSPTGGVPMLTRSGDLDPEILLYLMRNHHWDADRLEALVTHASGLRGICDEAQDMRALLTRYDQGDPQAELAIQIFTVAVRKQIGAYAALLGGVDLLVFTGGIGEHSEMLRRMICGGLEFLGIHLDGPNANVKVMAADEERQMIHICRSFL